MLPLHRNVLMYVLCLLIYIAIPAQDKDEANQWVAGNADLGAQDTFSENMTGSDGENYCLISIPEDGSEYTEKMKEHFTWTNDDPRQIAMDSPQEEVKEVPMLGKIGNLIAGKSSDNSEVLMSDKVAS